jgi:hypothetical protein
MRTYSLLFLAAATLRFMPGCDKATAYVQAAINKSPIVASVEESADGRVKVAGISIVPPTGWTQQPAPPPTQLMYFAPIQGTYRTNLNIVVEPLDSDETFDEMAKAMGDQVKTDLPKTLDDWVLASEENVKINGRDVYRVSSAFRVSPLVVLRNVQYGFRFHGGKWKCAVLTFTTRI